MTQKDQFPVSWHRELFLLCHCFLGVVFKYNTIIARNAGKILVNTTELLLIYIMMAGIIVSMMQTIAKIEVTLVIMGA